MPLDRDQCFVIDSITRCEIADTANDWMDSTNTYGDVRLDLDDDRLTDEVCREYARALGDIDDDASADFRFEAETSAIVYLIDSVGIVEIDSPEVDDEIGQLQNQINLLNLRLQAKLTEKVQAAIDKVL